MEHRKTRLFLSIRLLFTLLSLVFITIGCKKQLDQPELVDPIYIELVDASEKIKSNMKEEEKLLAESKKELNKSDLTVGEKRQVLKEIASSDKKLRLMAQDQKFFELRANSRVAHDREVYPARFEKDLPWPNPEEIAQFEANKRLRGASRNWADHIPKLKYGPDKSAHKAEQAEKAEEKN